MWPFGRRRRGRHAVGVYVTPSFLAGPVTLSGPIATLIASQEAWADEGGRQSRDVPSPVAPLGQDVGTRAHRVQLGFRDGSLISLDPEQAAPLEELADRLTSRD